MTWVANELILESKFNFFLECMRVPPDWHLWVYFLGDEHEAEKFQVTISLFREEEYGRMGDSSAFTAQRSYTGPVSSPNYINAHCISKKRQNSFVFTFI